VAAGEEMFGDGSRDVIGSVPRKYSGIADKIHSVTA